MLRVYQELVKKILITLQTKESEKALFPILFFELLVCFIDPTA